MSQEQSMAPEETLDEFEAGCSASALRGMRKEEVLWQKRGLCFSWIDAVPEWIGASDWGDFLPEEFEVQHPCKRMMRFALLGGGQIRTTEQFRERLLPGQEHSWMFCTQIDLKVTAHTPEGVVIVSGAKERIAYEMVASVVLLRGKHQDIADRVASTFRLMDCCPENFFALLDGSEGCAICGRPLRDEVSKLISVGPECARKYGVPHSREAAEKRLILRRQLLREEA